MSPVPVAFYAPLKPPDHPLPSGDRTMARLLLRALECAGFAPEVASGLRTWEGTGDERLQREIWAASSAEAERLVQAHRARPTEARPRLWFTYHCYYKAPDHLGPEVSRRLGIPYVIAEASRAPKRARGPWAFAHERAEAAIDTAEALLVLTGHDRECLERALRPGQKLVSLAPFVEIGPEPSPVGRGTGEAPRLLAVAMMRPGDKLASYGLLAEALGALQHLPWTLDIVGDGPARRKVEALFAPLARRTRFRGEADPAVLARLYGEADILVWPAVNEAYGMALLEAQAQGCPVVAGGFGGVPDVVRPGVTGLLSEPGDAADLARCVAALIAHPARRAAMGAAAAEFVRAERGIEGAAETIRNSLGALLRMSSAA